MTETTFGFPEANLSRAARIERSIAAKHAQLPKVDHNGKPIEGDPPVYTYDEKGMRVS